jgi:selenocysteine lyase/cysteine desulfurase
MVRSRRRFFKNAIGGLMLPAALDFSTLNSKSIEEIIPANSDSNNDEAYWDNIRKLYYQNPSFINLESGYFSPSAEMVKDDWIENINEINASPSYYMRTKQFKERDELLAAMAAFAEVSTEEIVLTRNTTESLNIVLQGINLQPNDEVLRTNREYPNMIHALNQRSERYGLKINVVDIPLQPQSKEEIVNLITAAITQNTKVLLVSHIIYLNGQVLPVKEITAAAHAKGVQVIVDGAHAFAHINLTIKEIGCDYYGCSLHKWFGAPLGNGLLYVKKDKVENVWPLFGDTEMAKSDIKKLSRFGTMPCSNQQAMRTSLAINQRIGIDRKQARLEQLRSYWTDKVKNTPKIKFNTPLLPGHAYAIANVGIEGVKPDDLAKKLFDRYKIFTVAINHDDIQGVRIAPNFHNTFADLDLLVKALKEIAAS